MTFLGGGGGGGSGHTRQFSELTSVSAFNDHF